MSHLTCSLLYLCGIRYKCQYKNETGAIFHMPRVGRALKRVRKKEKQKEISLAFPYRDIGSGLPKIRFLPVQCIRQACVYIDLLPWKSVGVWCHSRYFTGTINAYLILKYDPKWYTWLGVPKTKYMPKASIWAPFYWCGGRKPSIIRFWTFLRPSWHSIT